MTGAEVMPLPEDIREAFGQLMDDFSIVGSAISHTQVAMNPGDAVPGWIGESADAYTREIQKLGEHARTLPEIFAIANSHLEKWADFLGQEITKTIPDLHERYDQAQRNYDHNMDVLNEQIIDSQRNGVELPAFEIQQIQEGYRETLTNTQADIVADYKFRIDLLDAVARDAAEKIKAAQDAVVDPTRQNTRDAIGSALFDDIPILDGQAEWEYAQEIAPEAANIINNPSPSPEEISAFQEKYGTLCQDPFFAQALAEHTTPEQMTQFLINAERYRGALTNGNGEPNSTFDDSLNALNASFGSAIALSTGGINADPAVAQHQEAFSAARAGLIAENGSHVDNVISSTLDQWKAVGNTLLDANGVPVEDPPGYMGGYWGHHYGHEYLATMLSSAAATNPNLALGPEFFEGEDSLAQNIVAFDHAHGSEISAAGGYGNWDVKGPPGGDRFATDPVESMLKLMDQPAAFADESILSEHPSKEALQRLNSNRFDAVQSFLVSDTSFSIDPANEATRIPPLDGEGPMNMTRYLTSFRGDDNYTGTQDGGDSLGRVLAQAAMPGGPVPEGIERGTPEYEQWADRSERSATIAANFLVGYQEGLEIDNSLIDGVDPFGMQHPALRSWAGTIVAPHIEGITNSLQMPDGHGFSLRAPQSNDGYLINLSADLEAYSWV